jgi:heme/copper-type cytochrome/quinol oxidase subunit 2
MMVNWYCQISQNFKPSVSSGDGAIGWHEPIKKCGCSSVSQMDEINTFDLDEAGEQDNILVAGSQIHLLVNQPTKVFLRSKDVLHAFYVPQFRTKVDFIPGQIICFGLHPRCQEPLRCSVLNTTVSAITTCAAKLSSILTLITRNGY